MKRKFEEMKGQDDANTSEQKVKETLSKLERTLRFKFAADSNSSCKPVSPTYRKDDQEDPPEAARSILCM